MPKSKEERRKSRQEDYDFNEEGERAFKRSTAPSSTQNMLQMAAELVPSFDGREGTYPVAQWVVDVEDNAEIFGWTPLQQLLVARRSLKGTAALWLRAEKTHRSWDELKLAITKEFPETVDIKAVHEMMSARKKKADESCLDYMLVMKDLGKRGKMPDYVAIKYIVDGIPDVELHKIMLYGVTTYSDLKEKIKIYETIKSKMTEKQSEQEPVAASSKLKGKRIRCYGCGELGHTSFDCPHKSKGLKCFKCNEFGHVGSTCTKRTNDEKMKKPEEAFVSNRRASENFGAGKNKRAMFSTMAEPAANFTSDDEASYRVEPVERSDAPMMADYSDTESELSMSTSTESEVMVSVNKVDTKLRQITKKPIVSAAIGSRWVKTLIDSGSEVNIISSDFYCALGMPACEADDVKLSGIGLATVRSLGKCRLDLCFDGVMFDGVIFHVISRDFIPYDAILGQEFLKNVTVIIDGGSVRLASDECCLNVCVSEVYLSDFSIGHMTNKKLKQQVVEWVESCKPLPQLRKPPLQLKIILKAQDENRRNYNKNRKVSTKYEIGKLVAIKRTQFGAGLKLKVKRNDRFDVEKTDVCAEGPITTSTWADQMKRWPLPAEIEGLGE